MENISKEDKMIISIEVQTPRHLVAKYNGNVVYRAKCFDEDNRWTIFDANGDIQCISYRTCKKDVKLTLLSFLNQKLQVKEL